MVTGTGSAARPWGSADNNARCSDIASDVRHEPERSRHARHQITVAPIAVLATGASNHHIHAMEHTVNARHTRRPDARRAGVPADVRWQRSLTGTLTRSRPLTLT